MQKRLAAALVATIAGSVLATPSGFYVEYWNGSSWQSIDSNHDFPDDPGFNSGDPVTISDGSSRVYRAWAYVPETTDIGIITVSGSGTSPNLMVGKWNSSSDTALRSNIPLDQYGCRDLVAVVQDGVSLDVQLLVEDITGDGSSGSSPVSEVDRTIRVDSDALTGKININSAASSSFPQAGGKWFLGSMARGQPWSVAGATSPTCKRTPTAPATSSVRTATSETSKLAWVSREATSQVQ